MLVLAVILTIFLGISSNINASSIEIIEFTIPWPSGIQVDKVDGGDGQIFRFGRLQQNSISMRPQWSTINLIENVFSAPECREIIIKADIYAEKHGWSKGRHVDYHIRPTKDLPLDIIYESPDELRKVYQRFEVKIWPALAKEYHLNPAQLKPSDMFITKYNASAENKLGPHQDKSPWSFVIPLNDNFEGGGTYFFNSDFMWKPPVGAALYFSGNQFHGGVPITSGIRYILAGFVDYGEDTHEAFMEAYNPIHDGYAAQAGFKTGDMIVGLQICEESNEVKNEASDALSTQCGMDNSSEFSAECENAKNIKPAVIRKIVDITGDTTDEEWVFMAQSCEKLQPGADTVMVVKRYVK